MIMNYMNWFQQNTSLPFNKYAYLATHNSFAIKGEHSRIGKPRVTFPNQEDTITEQLNVRPICFTFLFFYPLIN